MLVYLSQFFIEAMNEYTYARVTVTKEAAGYDIDDDTAESLRELVVADYIVFLLSLDTYMRYLKTAHDLKTLTEGGEEDDVLQEGIRLLRYAERINLEDIVKEMRTSITSQAAQNLLDAAIRPQPTAKGIMVRALKLRTMLSRNYVAMTKAIFGVSMKARQTAREAIEASAMEDPDSALAKLASLTLRNKRLEQWVDKASEIVVTPGLVPLNPVKEATKGSTDGTTSLLASRVKEEGTSAATEEATQHSDAQGETLSRIEGEAVETAKKTLAKAGEEDKPITRSEAIGIATAAATAIASDPADMKNVPASFINNGRPLDPEQMAAALTDGRVLVAAGAGAGKSTTLISRIAYLVNEKGVYPTKILACSFNRKAADELKAKLSAKVGPGTADNVAVDTMHALFARMIMGDGKSIPGFGTPEEKSMIRDRLIAPTGKGRRGISPVSVTMTIRSIWKECKPESLAEMAGGGAPAKWFTSPPKAKQMNLYINQWQGNDVTLEQARASANSQTEAQAVVWFEMYLGLKGDIRGWRPICGQSKGYGNFMQKNRPGNERLGDLDDMLKIWRDILRRDPNVRKQVQGMFDHLLVDECQDLNTIQGQIFEYMSEHITDGSDGKSIWMVGDDKQCVSEDTPILVSDGVTLACDLKPGDKVVSYRNGDLQLQEVRCVIPTSWTWGYQVTTCSGLTLTMSPNHKLWATEPVLDEDRVLVYLMYRDKFGYRVGITNRHEAGYTYGQRPVHERADRLWVLEVHSDRESALLAEEMYSLEYGIPTQVFAGTERGLNQDRINALYAKFGDNGAKLLSSKNLDFNLPHWLSSSTTRGVTKRRVVHLVAHGSKGSHVRLEWSGDDLDELLVQQGITFHVGKTGDLRRLRKWFNSYREALTFSQTLSSLTGIPVRERLTVHGDTLNLLPSAGLLVGMSVPVCHPDNPEEVFLDPITSIQRVDGKFVDLDVDDASNFFGGGILSHNSIYQFRGAKPEQFIALNGKDGWKTRMIRTNYRCEPEIVEAANRLISHNDDRIPMDAQANPNKPRGQASIKVELPDDNATAAIDVVGRVRRDMDEEGAKPEDYAVLARTNAELNDYETACIINEIPYIRKGGKGFLEAPESRAVLGYMDLASGTDFGSMQKSLCAAIAKPDRGLYLGPDGIEKAVKDTIENIARYERRDEKSVDPSSILTDRNYSRMLAEELKKPYKNKLTMKGDWLWNKVVTELSGQILDMGRDVAEVRALVNNPDATTEGLINHILDNVKSTTKTWNPKDRREDVTVTSLREDITTMLANFDANEGEDVVAEEETSPEVDSEGRPIKDEALDEEKKNQGIGAVKFLFALSSPNNNDHEQGLDPSKAGDFQKKLARYAKLGETLKIDVKVWEREQSKIADPDKRKEKPPAIVLSTVHSVKGAEWKNVAVSMPVGLFPFTPKVKPGDPPPDPEVERKRMHAERNLAYVAVTRAAKNLRVLCPGSERAPAAMSKFVIEAGLAEGENVPKPGVAGGEVKTAYTNDLDDAHVQEAFNLYAPDNTYSRSWS